MRSSARPALRERAPRRSPRAPPNSGGGLVGRREQAQAAAGIEPRPPLPRRPAPPRAGPASAAVELPVPNLSAPPGSGRRTRVPPRPAPARPAAPSSSSQPVPGARAGDERRVSASLRAVLAARPPVRPTCLPVSLAAARRPPARPASAAAQDAGAQGNGRRTRAPPAPPSRCAGPPAAARGAAAGPRRVDGGAGGRAGDDRSGCLSSIHPTAPRPPCSALPAWRPSGPFSPHRGPRTARAGARPPRSSCLRPAAPSLRRASGRRSQRRSAPDAPDGAPICPVRATAHRPSVLPALPALATAPCASPPPAAPAPPGPPRRPARRAPPRPAGGASSRARPAKRPSLVGGGADGFALESGARTRRGDLLRAGGGRTVPDGRPAGLASRGSVASEEREFRGSALKAHAVVKRPLASDAGLELECRVRVHAARSGVPAGPGSAPCFRTGPRRIQGSGWARDAFRRRARRHLPASARAGRAPHRSPRLSRTLEEAAAGIEPRRPLVAIAALAPPAPWPGRRRADAAPTAAPASRVAPHRPCAGPAGPRSSCPCPALAIDPSAAPALPARRPTAAPPPCRRRADRVTEERVEDARPAPPAPARPSPARCPIVAIAAVPRHASAPDAPDGARFAPLRPVRAIARRPPALPALLAAAPPCPALLDPAGGASSRGLRNARRSSSAGRIRRGGLLRAGGGRTRREARRPRKPGYRGSFSCPGPSSPSATFTSGGHWPEEAARIEHWPGGADAWPGRQLGRQHANSAADCRRTQEDAVAQ
eukprot:tig00000382_g24558.t1